LLQRCTQHEGDAPIPRLIDLTPVTERAILVGTAHGRDAAAGTEEHLAELARLTDTAGAAVVGRLTQRAAAPTPRYFIGPGKVTELRALADESAATLVIFDDELSPSQGRNLEQALERRVMDRTEVILDIFATRAKSKEAKTQVELAQLEYLLPRLARMWVHLSRIRGGIGLRGPGETQIETDRRMIRQRISRLKRELERVSRHRAVLRQGRGRRPVPTVALVGYTNAGKSSLLRALTGAETLVDDRLFATLDTVVREMDLNDAGDGGGGGPGRAEAGSPASHTSSAATPRVSLHLRLVDTVGFIRKLPHNLVASFRATLEEARDADILAHVIDASHPDWEEQVDVVDRVVGELALGDRPVIHVFNKMDRVREREAFERLAVASYANAAFVSALRGDVGALLRVLSVCTLQRPNTRK
jgi:GTP-binding protein HflX